MLLINYYDISYITSTILTWEVFHQICLHRIKSRNMEDREALLSILVSSFSQILLSNLKKLIKKALGKL